MVDECIREQSTGGEVLKAESLEGFCDTKAISGTLKGVGHLNL
jgi:hypothetical protein